MGNCCLADPTRRSIFEELTRQGEQTVHALTRYAGVSQPAVSKHLTVLKRARLVRHRREGRETAATIAVMTSARHSGLIYDLTGPQTLTQVDVADILTRISGKSTTYIPIPRAMNLRLFCSTESSTCTDKHHGFARPIYIHWGTVLYMMTLPCFFFEGGNLNSFQGVVYGGIHDGSPKCRCKLSSLD